MENTNNFNYSSVRDAMAEVCWLLRSNGLEAEGQAFASLTQLCGYKQDNDDFEYFSDNASFLINYLNSKKDEQSRSKAEIGSEETHRYNEND